MGFNCFAVSVLYYVDMSNHMCKLHLKKYNINGDYPSPDHIPLMSGTLMNGSDTNNSGDLGGRDDYTIHRWKESGINSRPVLRTQSYAINYRAGIGSGDPKEMPCFAEEEEFKSTQAAMMTIFRCLATRINEGMG
jgi:hypothetical protein